MEFFIMYSELYSVLQDLDERIQCSVQYQGSYLRVNIPFIYGQELQRFKGWRTASEFT